MKRNALLKVDFAVLVYQAGIANVFAVDTWTAAPNVRNARRLLQSDFRACESFARGLAAAGVLVTSMHCNQAGEIDEAQWSEDVAQAPFFSAMCPVYGAGRLAEVTRHD